MSQMRRIFSGLPQSTLRQWRSTPTYIFLIWRWGTWLFALLWYLNLPKATVPYVTPIMPICLVLTFAYSLITTFYAPVSRVLLIQFSNAPKHASAAQRPGRKSNRQLLAPGEEAR